MSNKTTKRLALGVIASLVFAPFAAVAPASAVTAFTSAVTQTEDGVTHGIVRAYATAPVTITTTLTGSIGGGDMSARLESRPAGATASDPEVGDVFTSPNTAVITLGAAKTLVNASCTVTSRTVSSFVRSGNFVTVTSNAHGFSAGDTVTVNIAGTWDHDGDDSGLDLVAFSSVGSFTITGVSTNSFQYANAGDNVGTDDQSLSSSSASAPTAYVAAAANLASNQTQNVGDALVLTSTTTQNCGGVARTVGTTTATGDFFTTAGAYVFTVWYDADGDGVKGISENVQGSVTVTVAGAPSAITITPALTMQASNTGDSYDNPVWIYLRDAAGNASKLIDGEEMNVRLLTQSGDGTLEVGNSDSGRTADVAFGSDLNLVNDEIVGLVGTSYGTYYPTAVKRTGGTIQGTSASYRVTLGGSLSATTTASTTLVFANRSDADSMSVKAGTKGVTREADTRFEFPVTIEDGSDDSVVANPLQAQSITYVVTGTPGRYVNVTVDNLDGTTARLGTGVMPTGLNNLVRPILIGVNGTAEVTVAATAAIEGDGYDIGVYTDGGTSEYEVNYNAATVNTNTIIIDELPSSGITKMLTPVGGASTFNLTIADEYDGRYSGYTVRLSTATLQRNASKTVDALTAADGKARVSLTDAGTTASVAGTSTTLDSIKLSVFVPNNTATDLLNRSVSVFYGANTGGSMDLYGGTTLNRVWQTYVAADDTSDLDDGNGILGSRDNAGVPGTAVLRTSTGAPESGYAMKVSGVTPGIKFLSDVLNNGMSTGRDTWDGAVDVLHVPADGNIRFYALASRVGVNTVKVELGGFSKEMSFTAFTHAEFARNLVWTPATVAAVGASRVVGTPVELAVTVQDGFGNGVAGVSPTFNVTNGRSLSGASGAVVPTGSTGVASLQVTRDTAGTLSAEVLLTGGQTTARAGFPIAGWAAPITRVTSGNVAFVDKAPEYDKPTLSVRKANGRVILSGTAVEGEGDIIIYIKSVGTTTWKERAKTLEVAAPGDFNGSVKAPKNDVVIRVKQEGTGLFSNQVIVLK